MGTNHLHHVHVRQSSSKTKIQGKDESVVCVDVRGSLRV